MTISAIVICILILLLAMSLGVNVWFAETLKRMEPDLDENSPRFGWTVEEYDAEIRRLEGDVEALSRSLSDAKTYIDAQERKLDFLMERQ